MPPVILRHKKMAAYQICQKLEILHLRINMRVSSFLQFRHLYLCACFVSGCYYSISICIAHVYVP